MESPASADRQPPRGASSSASSATSTRSGCAHARRAPGPGEVELEVRAAGLNFRDVLSALGEMPNVTAGLTPGSEVAGVVTALGPGVKRFAVGDAVAGIARGTLATHVTTAAHALGRAAARPRLPSRRGRAARVPDRGVRAREARARRAGRARADPRAAGGVGLAAIQIARRLGAEIYATAGDDDKRAYLRALGIRHVFDSRSLSFATACARRPAARASTSC
jgi:NADPH:quinone reductase-like Zn-dependent oxidoreductase